MFVPNDFVWHCFVAQVCTKMCVCPGICANMHDKATQTKPLATINGTISRNMPTNFEPKRLKSKLDFKKMEFGGFAVEAATHRADYSPQK